jgi:hypothetical protein
VFVQFGAHSAHAVHSAAHCTCFEPVRILHIMQLLHRGDESFYTQSLLTVGGSTSMKYRSSIVMAVAAAALVECLSGCAVDTGEGDSESTLAEAVTVNPRTSLMITDRVLLEHPVHGIRLQAVLDQFATQSGIAGMSSDKLFRQLWDTFNVAPGLNLGPHCNRVLTNGVPSVNGYPVQCPRAEGGQISAAITEYTPIAAVNRFDLADASPRPTHCGEYRLIFARGVTTGSNRNLIIFEGKLPNPNPAAGACACAPVVRFWQDLATVANVTERAHLLHDFYFNGLPGFRPIVHINNFGLDSAGTGGGYTSSPSGQIRTNSFIDTQRGWNLREFKIAQTCRPILTLPRPLPIPTVRDELLRRPTLIPVLDVRPGIAAGPSVCTLQFVQVSVKTNPDARLFNATLPGSTDFYAARAAAFQGVFPTTVPGLALNDVNRFGYDIPNVYNAAESPVTTAGRYTVPFAIAGGGSLRTAIQTRLSTAGSTLTPDNIVRRAEALSCQGCHQSSNNANLGGGIVWPSSLGFVHVSDIASEPSPLGGNRWRISPALAGTFLPHRASVMETYLNETCKNTQVSLVSRRPVLLLPITSPVRTVRAIVTTTELSPQQLSALEAPVSPTLGGRTTH